MPIEIEHKYLVKSKEWNSITPLKSVEISQGYLLTDPNKTIRVRLKGNTGYITIKGKTKGASRLEYEYEIPVLEAKELLGQFCSNVIEKIRHYVVYEQKTWEVDVFKGVNEGLIVAEIELLSEQESYKLPNWIAENVTDDHRYANANLALKPYSTW